jgi:hypothetical protein
MTSHLETCPVCNEQSSHCWADTTSYDVVDHIHHGMKLEPGTIGHIGVSSCWEWECPHCGSHVVDADSPLNHPAYTHGDD